MAKQEKRTVESWLNSVDYEFKGYMPTDEALKFVNFIKAVNGGSEENETPPVHLVMMENVFNKDRRCAIMCHRGIGKTTVFAEYLILYMAAFGYMPGFGKVNLMLYVTDSIENGVKNLRRNVEFRYQESEFLQAIIPNQKIQVGTNGAGFVDLDEFEEQTAGGRKFTDIRLEFMNNKGHRLVVKGYGAKALSLDTRVYTADGYTTIGECQEGQKIYGPDGKLATITAKSEIFHKPMYKLELEDGRYLKVSEDHINSVMVNTRPNGTATWEDRDMTTLELIKHGWQHTKKVKHYGNGVSNKCIMKIRNTDPLKYPECDMEVDPYTLGLILGDGAIKKNASGVVVTGEEQDCNFYREIIPYELGDNYLDKRTESVMTFSIKGINQQIRNLDLAVHGSNKFIPEEYFITSTNQRLELLQGLLDTDGSIFGNGRITFVSSSERLVDDTARLVRSLGGKAKKTQVSDNAYKIEIWIGMNPFKLPRKRDRFVENKRSWNTCNVVNIERIEDEPSQCIAIDNENHQFLAGDYFRTHNTGVRGAKEMGQRPTLAVLDDLISDEDARSETIIETIENTIYKAVSKALHPQRQKMVFIGTPFNARDPLYKAVESGAWTVSVYPICEAFPVSREEFRGSWEDRFTYDYVQAEYDEAIALGKPENFNQELMLRIMSAEDRVIQDDDLQWFSRDLVKQSKSNYNFYITTDFAVSSKKKADFSVISVWAYNNNGDWMLVDGVCKKQLLDKSIDDLFRLVQMYKPLSVGIEVSGQQGGFISWINQEMVRKNVYFNLASNSGSSAGIRPIGDKMTRFNQVLPLFKQKKMWFPKEMEGTDYIAEFKDEIANLSKGGFKSKHDDVCDTISMLSEMEAFRPSLETADMNPVESDSTEYWRWEEDESKSSGGSTVF